MACEGYRSTGRETVIPANPMTTGVVGAYAYTYSHTKVTGQPQSFTMPAVGGLAKEKVVTRCNGDGLAESTSDLAWYTYDVTYSPLGEVRRRTCSLASTKPAQESVPRPRITPTHLPDSTRLSLARAPEPPFHESAWWPRA